MGDKENYFNILGNFIHLPNTTAIISPKTV